jgi:RNA polymerase sigma factor (sigma-70 family)
VRVMDETMQELWRAPARRRLVRLCAAISGDPAAAEDLAQETLLEAWRNAHKLRDPSGAERWLAAIARNVCLRSARRRGRRPLLVAEEPAGDEVDLDAELERTELLELLDRALALLPPETREALVQRYVDDAPHGEIAARLGVSEDAVSMRLARGKMALRRMLAAELGREAEVEWRETRVWCGQCGRRKLGRTTP